ncbi:phosphoenolpyruvate--protein phosphotransferase [Sphingomonas astaxanthinifaciens]|uniref:phosphoenolpyruvate--protein phosphotransferase n=1 Tax=Sphingomonas astaxanthinifaciens DSM 22298 TaxID=1123267 RepID=A0ABQ5Z9G3_9SPHN|nr:phosphoenolpyruvate--protein phosphotransferase [Sphingomonas astaxanthinifaciens]GLR48131.1 phosphoenolpyruvate--protein phosphotransferase [Sphingomonas astaxanthinifaciens DSM 22298]
MPLSAATSAREILTGLHGVMAGRGAAQTKLDHVVDLIAEAMGSEVCSIYLLRDSVLELFATHGLNKEAVHVTRLAPGQGLVGTIVSEGRILNLAEASNHPAFAYRPETGEDKFHSFAGVPIIFRERAIGVLAVQHADPRAYADVEIEALQTVAMVLSELIAGARLVDGAERRGGQREGMVRLAGLKLVAGMARGTAVFHQPRVVVEHTVADDPELERSRVISAFRKMREQIEHMTREAEFGTAGEHQEILETYKMFAYDEGWVRRINTAIDSGLTAEAAIERVQQRTRARMQEIDDPLLKERMHDLEDLSNRLMRIVSGRMGTAAQTGLSGDAILIARNLGPAELLEYDRRRLKGVVLEEGSLTAHVTIVARAMGVPVIGRVKDIGHIAGEGDTLLIDGNQGSLVVRPTRTVATSFEGRMAMSQRRRAEFAAIRALPPITKDGLRATLMVNAGLAEDAAQLDLSGADGIGLFRTEFQFLISAALPGRDAQYRLYRQVLEAAGDRPVVFRTVDIGGDKALPYLADASDESENPAMGWRALRLSLDRTALMKAQARALIEAAEGRILRVMFPMISEPWEYEEARALFEAQIEWVKKRKPGPAKIEFGAMLEVPSLAEMLDQLLPRVDFLSIGTNDLTQFLFAADRADPRLALRYDWLSPAILRFLRRISVEANAAGVPVRVCGEMGGRPLEAMALVGIGITNFSITPAAVGPVKAMLRSLDAAAVQAKVAALLAKPPRDMRKTLTDWARRHSVALD